MSIDRKTLVVVPCYNEAARLHTEAFFEALEREPLLGFVMVDDGSTDSTLSLLEEMREKRPDGVHVVRLVKNSGKAEAVRVGVLRAFELGAHLTGYWDADLATPLSYIAQFAEVLKRDNIALVLGSRVRLLGHRIERKALRHFVGRGFGTLASLSLGLHVYDTQCGAKLFKTTPAMHGAFETAFSLRWSFDVELLARLLAREVNVGDICVAEQAVEFPLEEWNDAAGSKITLRQFPSIALELARLYATTRGVRRPKRR